MDPKEIIEELYEAAKEYVSIVDSVKRKMKSQLTEEDKQKTYDSQDRLLYAAEDVKKLKFILSNTDEW